MHLSIICRHFHPISLQQLSSGLRNRQVINRGVVITFDDGYADNLLYAKPILEKYGVPATVFVVSGSVGSQREFFWDDLGRIFFNKKELPDVLEVNIGERTYTWGLYNKKEAEPASDSVILTGLWNVEVKANPTERHRAYRELSHLLSDVDEQERDRVLSALYGWANISPRCRDDHRALTVDELYEIEKGGWIEIGAHTRSHVRLSQQSDIVQQREIFDSREKLEKMIGHPIRCFSYPFGGPADYNDLSIKLTREAGFDCACSNFPGYVHRWINPFQLPRMLVRNWDAAEFEQQLIQWRRKGS